MKTTLSVLIAFIVGIVVSWAIFTSIADTQAEREARIMAACDAPLRAEIHKCRTMESCKLDGASFLKTAGVEK
jgi:capsular polysaccharide biosynthesis protein